MSQTRKFTPYFDPDEVVLTKHMIQDLCDAIIHRWKKDKKKHFWQISGLQTFKLSLHAQSDEAINEVMRAIITFVNDLQRYNAMLRLKGEMPKMEDLVDLTIRQIREGKA